LRAARPVALPRNVFPAVHYQPSPVILSECSEPKDLLIIAESYEKALFEMDSSKRRFLDSGLKSRPPLEMTMRGGKRGRRINSLHVTGFLPTPPWQLIPLWRATRHNAPFISYHFFIHLVN
jgi:hypothetical protein